MWDTPNRELSFVGRWLSPDPAGAGWNQYAYVTNNPLALTDPTGLGGPCPLGQTRYADIGGDCIPLSSLSEVPCQASSPCIPCPAYLGGQPGDMCPTSVLNGNSNDYFNSTISQNEAEAERAHQAQVDDAFNGTNFYDPKKFQNGPRLYTPGAAISFVEGYGFGGVDFAYDYGSWYLPGYWTSGVGEDTHPGLAALYDSAQCPTCGQIFRNANRFVKIATAVQLGAVGLAVGSPMIVGAYSAGATITTNGYILIESAGVPLTDMLTNAALRMGAPGALFVVTHLPGAIDRLRQCFAYGPC